MHKDLSQLRLLVFHPGKMAGKQAGRLLAAQQPMENFFSPEGSERRTGGYGGYDSNRIFACSNRTNCAEDPDANADADAES